MADYLFEDPTLAAMYDAFCAGRPDWHFYLPLVMTAGSVLDVGCGTGELLRLARAGGHAGRLCGIDPAEGMLQQARMCEDIEWIQGTLAAVELPGRFDLIVMTGHAFQVLLDDAELRQFFTSVRSALSNDGRFVFETRNPLVCAWERWDEERVDIIHDGAPVTMSHEVHSYDGEYLSFSNIFSGPAWDAPQDSPSRLRFLSRDALTSFLTEAGLAIETQYGDWDHQPLTDESPEIITVARRA